MNWLHTFLKIKPLCELFYFFVISPSALIGIKEVGKITQTPLYDAIRPNTTMLESPEQFKQKLNITIFMKFYCRTFFKPGVPNILSTQYIFAHNVHIVPHHHLHWKHVCKGFLKGWEQIILCSCKAKSATVHAVWSGYI